MSPKEKIERYDWRKAEDKPELKWVDVSKLHIDGQYQRTELKESTILAIARDFNWKAFGTISVMERDGKFYITDGQHRVHAVKRRGDITKVPVNITKSNGVESEAMAFFEANSCRVAVGAYNKFRAMLVSGDELYVECNNMLERIGLFISNQESLNSVAFPAELIKTYSASPTICEKCLVFQKQVNGNKPLNSKIHKGLFEIVWKTKSDRIFDFEEKLKLAGGRTAILKEMKVCAIETGQNISSKIAALGILRIVNNKLRTNRIEITWSK